MFLDIASQDGRYRVRLAAAPRDIRAAQHLRFLAFRAGAQLRPAGLDRDAHDAGCQHVLIEEKASDRLVCCFRMMTLGSGRAIGRSYSADHYDLAGLAGFPGRMLEMGRFCLHPEVRDPDVVRLAWSSVAHMVVRRNIEFLFGCTSFCGTHVRDYLPAFGALHRRHVAPRQWLPGVKAADVVEFSTLVAPGVTLDDRRIPPLLRSYLSMGGWVSDHAVVDHDLNRIHVFTGLEVARIPAARARFILKSGRQKVF